jgi:hypothetical protein
MKNRTIHGIILILMVLAVSLFSGCIFFQDEGRLSGTVMFIHSSPVVQDWLQQPKKSYIQTYFLFPSDLASDIIFGIDQEMIEGINDPIHFPGADWMALIGLTRDGVLSIPVGTSDALNGTPSDASVWEFIDLGVSLQPNTWYFMKGEANFETRKFESFTLLGPEVNISVDLSEYYVDYPNYIPIDNRSMTYYVYAIRMAGDVQLGSTTIYFDDVEAGIETDSGYTVIMQDGFETQYTIPDIPITLPVTPISQIEEYFWYKENENALLSVVDTQTHSGSYSCLCNVTLEGLNQIGQRHIFINKYLSHRFFPMLESNSVLRMAKRI